jgi:alcohol dehydrogenase class IV
MSSIQERLRQVARQMGYDKEHDPYGMVEAADHIDTLKARVAELEKIVDAAIDSWLEDAPEVSRKWARNKLIHRAALAAKEKENE